MIIFKNTYYRDYEKVFLGKYCCEIRVWKKFNIYIKFNEYFFNTNYYAFYKSLN